MNLTFFYRVDNVGYVLLLSYNDIRHKKAQNHKQALRLISCRFGILATMCLISSMLPIVVQ